MFRDRETTRLRKWAGVPTPRGESPNGPTRRKVALRMGTQSQFSSDFFDEVL